MNYPTLFFIKLCTYLGVGFLLLAGQMFAYPAFPVKIHILIGVLHFVGLVSVLSIGFFKKDMLGLGYLAFLVMKMGVFLYLFYKNPVLKEQIMASLVCYFVYLLLETILIISVIQKNNKFSEK